MGGGFTYRVLAVPGGRGSGGHPVEDRLPAPPTRRKVAVDVDERTSNLARRDTLEVRHAYGRRVPQLTAHPTVLTDTVLRARPAASPVVDDGAHGPFFAAPALILVATLAIFEGYHWLHLFPGGSVRLSSLLVVVVVAPVTFALTRRLHTPRWAWARPVARASASAVLLLGLVATFGHATALSRVLGLTYLVLAASIVSLVIACERRRSPRRLPD